MTSPSAPPQVSIEAALRAVAERQRRELGPHLETDELVAYHEAMLPEEPAERVRDHLALCPECAGRLLDLDAFHAASPDGTPDAEAEAAWRELAPRLGEEGGEVVPLRRPAVSTPAWRALAAVLFLGVIGLSIWVASLRRGLREGGAVHPATIVDLWAPGDESRGASDAVTREDAAVLVIHLPEGTAANTDFEAEILGPAGAVEWNVAGLHANHDGNKVSVALDPGRLKARGYTLRLYGLRGGARRLVGVYPLPPPGH